MAIAVETFEFQAEARQLMHLVIHSVYSNRDTFLRELISNASDALDKLRLESYRDKELQADTSDLHVVIEPDEEQRTLTVRDNGIGMSRDEVVSVIGTIAKSGTAELLNRLRDTSDSVSPDLIGQFGIGFYSSFMVADKVTVTTRRAGDEVGTRWESDGNGTYTIEPVPDLPQGTTVVVHLKGDTDDDKFTDYTDPWRIRDIVKRYSDFIGWPIRMSAELDRDDDDQDDERPGVETVNSMKALWARHADDVDEAEYSEFYRQISHDWSDPLETIRMHAEGTFEYEALLFIPARAPLDLYLRNNRYGLHLYVRRVFIMDSCVELMPEYLRFIKGVVDSYDLPLNVSRETLQHDRRIQLMRRRLVKKVLSTVRDTMSNSPERYQTFWREFGRTVKEGLLNDYENRDQILDICSFPSTHDPEQLTGLRQYVDRMKDGQEAIYYMTGESRLQIEASPHLEAFRAKGYEVLFLTDPVDDMWIGSVPEFAGKRFQSIARGEVDLDAGEQDDVAETENERARQQDDFSPLLTWMADVLSDHVREVRLSSRLTTSPACLVGDNQDPSPTMEKVYRAMGHEMPTIQRVLELNPAHPLVIGLRSAYGDRADSDLADAVELLHGTALLAEGGELADPARFTSVLTQHLQRHLTP